MKKVKVTFLGSGIGMMSMAANLALILGIMAFVIFAILALLNNSYDQILVGLPYLVGGILFNALGKCIISITEVSLYKKALLKEKAKEEGYEFVDDDGKTL